MYGHVYVRLISVMSLDFNNVLDIGVLYTFKKMHYTRIFICYVCIYITCKYNTIIMHEHSSTMRLKIIRARSRKSIILKPSVQSSRKRLRYICMVTFSF